MDLTRVMQDTWVDRVHYFDSVNSTNSAALTHAQDRGAPHSEPNLAELFVANRQTAGRGRGSNVWWSAEGALTYSVLTPPVETPAHCLPQVSLAMGVAICKAVEHQIPASDVALKWPNDVYLNQQKVAGILIELTPASPKRMVIGVGLNVNNRMADAPTEIHASAISMLDAAGKFATPFDRTEVLIACLSQIESHLDQFFRRAGGLIDAWREYSLLTGRYVEIVSPRAMISGTCEGIADDGALLVRTQAGLEPCHGGVVSVFR